MDQGANIETNNYAAVKSAVYDERAGKGHKVLDYYEKIIKEIQSNRSCIII